MTESLSDATGTALSGDYRAKTAAILAADADLVLHCNGVAGKLLESADKALWAEFGHTFEAVA